ncbi:hypothetical protein ABKN59_007902 [Abortiporus biennis]
MSNDVVPDPLFSVRYPLPFRVLALVGIGILSWATNLQGLNILGINAVAALDLNSHHPRSLYTARSPLPTNRAGWKVVSDPHTIYMPVYRLFVQYSIVVGVSWLLFRHATKGEIELVDVFKFIPAVTALLLFMVLVSPFKVFQKGQRDAFLNAIHRCCFSPRVLFADVVFADVLTSFAKVIGDVWLSVCMLVPDASLLIPPAQQGLSRWILPTLMSVPYAVRFRQCLIEYMDPTNESRKPFYNAIKYASSFPVIYLSAAQRIVVSDLLAFNGPVSGNEGWFGDRQLFQLWLLAAAFNSLYSFWWDITNDWGFDLLLPRASKGIVSDRSRVPPKKLVLPHLHSRSSLLLSPPASEEKEILVANSPQDRDNHEQRPADYTHHRHSDRQNYPFGLRPTLLFPLPIYPFAIVADLVLRMTWSAKLSSHLHSFAEGDLIIFWIEIAEIVRRWMWLFLRVEWEVVKEREGHRHKPHHTHHHGDTFASTGHVASIAEEEYELIPSDSSERSARANEVG